MNIVDSALRIGRLCLLFCVAAFAAGRANGQPVFTDWMTADVDANTASGTLGSIQVVLTTDVAVPDVFGNGGVNGAALDGSSTIYSTTNFLPAIPSTDAIGVGTASSFSLRFSSPVTNPVLHIWQLANNTWSFTDGTNPVMFKVLASDGKFSVATGDANSTIKGVSDATDSSGSLEFIGTFTRLSWTSSANQTGDGAAIQVSVSNPCFTMQQIADGSLNSLLVGLLPGQTVVLQSSTNLVNWTSFETNIASSQSLSVTNFNIDPQISAKFFRSLVQ